MRQRLVPKAGDAARVRVRGHDSRRLYGRPGVVAVAVLAVLVAAGGVAVAAIPDAGTGVFHGCYSTETGALLTG
jgi:hypothetical protein